MHSMNSNRTLVTKHFLTRSPGPGLFLLPPTKVRDSSMKGGGPNCSNQFALGCLSSGPCLEVRRLVLIHALNAAPPLELGPRPLTGLLEQVSRYHPLLHQAGALS